jgi:hypothetical protein
MKNVKINLTISAGVLTSVFRTEVVAMTVYEALNIMLSFATFVVLFLSYIKK